ncbi:glycosyltransferase family 4 protein [Maricaulis sp. CAU 1757]
MIVLQVIPQLDAGGAERTTLEMVEAIRAEGGTALVASQGGRLEGELEALGGELIRLPLASKNPFVAWSNTNALARLIEARDIDIVHARSRAPAWSAKWACGRTGAHFVTTYHGTYNARSALKKRYNSVMAAGERVIANSEFIRDHVSERYPEAIDRLRVIPRGVDLARFDPETVSEQRVGALRDSWSLPATDGPLILLPARLTAWKGQREAIRALALLHEQPDLGRACLVLAGDAQGRDAYVDSLLDLARELGVSDRVHLVGHCSDIPAALAAADLVLTPSVEPEAFGRTAAEAGAMERLVIAADHGGAREVVRHAETGWRVPPGDAEALAAAMAGALALPAEARREMQRHARAHIVENYSTAALQAATLRVYHEVLNSQP